MKKPWPRQPNPTPDEFERYRQGLALVNKIRREEDPDEWCRLLCMIVHACKKALAWEERASEPVWRLAAFDAFYDDLRSVKNGLAQENP